MNIFNKNIHKVLTIYIKYDIIKGEEYKSQKEESTMEKIKNVESKLSNDSRRLRAYQYHEKYEAMLIQYMCSKKGKILLVPNLKNPFKYAEKKAREGHFTEQEYEAFCNKIEQIKKENPAAKLSDLSSKEGREVIGSVISDVFGNSKFKTRDLESVAVAKCYNVCSSLKDSEGKTNFEIVKILQHKKVPISVFQEAQQKYEKYKADCKPELYNRIRKEVVPEMVHITAAALEIGPGEAEESLVAFGKIEGRKPVSDFDRRVKIQQDEVSKFVLDQIIMNDELTVEEKVKKIDFEENKIVSKNKEIKALLQQWERNGRNLKDIPQNFAERHGIEIIDDDREVG